MKVILLVFASVLLLSTQTSALKCVIAEKPEELLTCLSLSPALLTNVIQNKDWSSFCKMAKQYLGCMSSYIGECVGGKLAVGAIEEIDNLNQKCCIYPEEEKCPFTYPETVGKCIAGDNLVTLDNNKSIKIIDLKIGDKVKTLDSNGALIDSEVVAFLHKEVRKEAKFVNIHGSNDKQVSMTESHLININKKGFIKAADVQIGDEMIAHNSQNVKVVKIETEIKEGFTAPLTQEGTILVNDILVSCYAEVNSHWLAHMVMKPVNIWYQISKYIGLSETANRDGLHSYASFLFDLSATFLPSLFV